MKHIHGKEILNLDAISSNENQNARVNVRLPCFDTLVEIAKEDPEQLERLRDALTQQLIDNAPTHRHHRLNGLQFKIDLERERAGSALSACITLSEMTHESLQRLKEILTNPEEYLRNQTSHSAEVIPFEPKQTPTKEP